MAMSCTLLFQCSVLDWKFLKISWNLGFKKEPCSWVTEAIVILTKILINKCMLIEEPLADILDHALHPRTHKDTSFYCQENVWSLPLLRAGSRSTISGKCCLLDLQLNRQSVLSDLIPNVERKVSSNAQKDHCLWSSLILSVDNPTCLWLCWRHQCILLGCTSNTSHKRTSHQLPSEHESLSPHLILFDLSYFILSFYLLIMTYYPPTFFWFVSLTRREQITSM